MSDHLFMTPSSFLATAEEVQRQIEEWQHEIDADLMAIQEQIGSTNSGQQAIDDLARVRDAVDVARDRLYRSSMRVIDVPGNSASYSNWYTASCLCLQAVDWMERAVKLAGFVADYVILADYSDLESALAGMRFLHTAAERKADHVKPEGWAA